MEIDDPVINLNIAPPTLDFYNQPITPAVGFYVSSSTASPSTSNFAHQQRKLSFSSQLTLQEIPPVPLTSLEATPPILERNIITNKSLKPILTTLVTSNKKKKRVHFKNDLVQVHYFECDKQESLSQTNIHRKSLKDLELSERERVLSWEVKWLRDLNLPDDWQNVAMKTKYESVEEYKNILKSLMRIEVLSKLKKSNTSSIQSTTDFISFMVHCRKQCGEKYHHQLELSNAKNPKYLYRGLLLIMRIKDANKVDADIFGYVSEMKTKSSDDNPIAVVEIIYKDMPLNLSVVKCKSLGYLHNDIRGFVAVENLQDAPLVHKIIDPELNEMKTSEGDLNVVAANLTSEQNKLVNVITQECFFNSDANIIALQSKAGTGKTKILIESIINIILNSKRDGIKRSILVCAMSNYCIDAIANETQKHSMKPKKAKLARVGDIDKVGAKNLHLHDLKSINDFDVVFTTVNRAYDIYNYKKDFDVCFIDDANCCMDSELVILLQLNITKLFLIGDIHQTQPMAQSEELLHSKYDETFFARMINTFKDKPVEGKPILVLHEQHRMEKELAEIVDG